MKRKFCLALLVFSVLSSFIFAQEHAQENQKNDDLGKDSKTTNTYVVHKFEATSSKDNPGVLNITTSYEKKGEDGNIIKDSKNESVDVSGYKGYSIKMNDNDAGFKVEEADLSDLTFKDFGINPIFDDLYAFDYIDDSLRRDFEDFNFPFDDFWYDDCDCWRCRRDRMLRHSRMHRMFF